MSSAHKQNVYHAVWRLRTSEQNLVQMKESPQRNAVTLNLELVRILDSFLHRLSSPMWVSLRMLEFVQRNGSPRPCMSFCRQCAGHVHRLRSLVDRPILWAVIGCAVRG